MAFTLEGLQSNSMKIMQSTLSDVMSASMTAASLADKTSKELAMKKSAEEMMTNMNGPVAQTELMLKQLDLLFNQAGKQDSGFNALGVANLFTGGGQ